MMYVINVNRNDVFQKLLNGAEVYRFDANTHQIANLKCCTVETALKEVEDKDNGFFIVESEE